MQPKPRLMLPQITQEIRFVMITIKVLGRKCKQHYINIFVEWHGMNIPNL